MAKRAREQAVKEKRERKHERKAAAAAARLAGDVAPADDDVAGEPGLEDDDVEVAGEPAAATESS